MDQVLEFAGNQPYLVGGFIVVLGLLIWTEVKTKVQGLEQLSPAMAVPWINHEDAVVVDISPLADFNKGHIVKNIHQVYAP